MGKMKDLRQFIAEDLCSKNRSLDIDKAFVMVDELWHDATVGKSKKAQAKIGAYAKEYRGC